MPLEIHHLLYENQLILICMKYLGTELELNDALLHLLSYSIAFWTKDVSSGMQ